MSDQELFESTLEFAQGQVWRLVERHPGFYPMYTHHGCWRHDLPAWTRWCDGFLPGMMWIFHSRQPQGSAAARRWLELAIRYTEPLDPRKFDREVHDLGFLFLSTYLRWFRLTGEPHLREVLIEAGRTLSLRFMEKGGYLRSFVSADSLFIDIMMNVEIIFCAARETGDERLYDIARRHCFTTRRVLVRGDGSTAHEGLFDLASGEFLRQSTHQGWRGDSCWTRGLAWALHGFGTSYRYTRDAGFLATAQACADFYLANASGDGVPPWDFDAPPKSRTLVDTSAAAIAAGGLLQLSRLIEDSGRRSEYRSAALRILRTLCDAHTARRDPAWEGILKHGVYHLHEQLGVDESVMWGEYFFVDALDQALET